MFQSGVAWSFVWGG